MNMKAAAVTITALGCCIVGAAITTFDLEVVPVSDEVQELHEGIQDGVYRVPETQPVGEEPVLI